MNRTCVSRSKLARQFRQMRASRTFARDDEQRIRPARAQAHEHAQQEVDVLLERHAPDVQQQRTVGRQIERACGIARRRHARNSPRASPVGSTSMGVVTP